MIAISEDSLIVADLQGVTSAATALIERRISNQTTHFMPLLSAARQMLFDQLIGALMSSATTDDARLDVLSGFAAGRLTINNAPQEHLEREVVNDAQRHALADCFAVSDEIIFRSEYERQLALGICGRIPARSRVARHAPSEAEAKPLANTQRDAPIAVCGAASALRSYVALVLGDLRRPIVFLEKMNEWSASDDAACIVNLSGDPADDISLAMRGRPLCTSSIYAGEYLTDVTTFRLYDPREFKDAVLSALGNNAAPRIRSCDWSSASEESLPTKDGPLVTIVVTVYNRLDELDKNLARLQDQTYRSIEIVVVSNNGPWAGDIVSKYENAKYIHREHNTGSAEAPRNDGWRAANGTYIMFLDDDDFILNDHVQRMVRAAANAPIVYSDFILRIIEDDGEGATSVAGWDIERPIGVSHYDLLVNNRIGYMTVFCEKRVLEEIDGFDGVRALGGSEVDLWLRMTKNFPIARVDRPTSVYTMRRRGNNSLSTTSHSLYSDGYRYVYSVYPTEDMPIVHARRQEHLASLERTPANPGREPRYLATLD